MNHKLEGMLEIDVAQPDQDCLISCLRAMQYTWKVPLHLENTTTGESLELMFFESHFGAEFKDKHGSFYAKAEALDLEAAVGLMQSFKEGKTPDVSGPNWSDITAERDHLSAARTPLADKWLIGILVVVGLGLLIGAIVYVQLLTP